MTVGDIRKGKKMSYALFQKKTKDILGTENNFKKKKKKRKKKKKERSYGF